MTATPRGALSLSMSGRPRSELASEEASAMPQESVRQIQLKEIALFFSLSNEISSFLFLSLNVLIRLW